MASLKSLVSTAINSILLKPFKLRLSLDIGLDAMSDIKILMKGHDAKYVVDGGAHKGTFSLEISSEFPAASIHAFEPQTNSHFLLVENVSKNPNIKVHRCALGEETGSAKFYTNVSALTSSLSKTSENGLEYFKGYTDPEGVEEVTVTTLSDFLDEEQIPYLDILKLDLQGHELQAIRGLNDYQSKVKLIFMEIQFLQIYRDTPVFSEVESYLRDNNYIFYQFYDLVRSPKDGRLLYGDAIFLNTSYIDLTK